MEMNHDNLIKKILNKIQFAFNINIGGEMEVNFSNFLADNQFDENTSSLIVISHLKSQMCNYLSYFQNFQIVYHSKSTASNYSNDKLTSSSVVDDLETKLTKIGVYPILNDISSIHQQTEEEALVIDEILNGPKVDGNLSSDGILIFIFRI